MTLASITLAVLTYQGPPIQASAPQKPDYVGTAFRYAKATEITAFDKIEPTLGSDTLLAFGKSQLKPNQVLALTARGGSPGGVGVCFDNVALTALAKGFAVKVTLHTPGHADPPARYYHTKEDYVPGNRPNMVLWFGIDLRPTLRSIELTVIPDDLHASSSKKLTGSLKFGD
ncbi:MAG: hypothetical protein JST12_14375 [Armatimonadetes bacterium]|nr:hypothetical protein [Armatimonadota bacterium]